jgi:hypothetical protein
MQFMVIRKADETTEAGVPPSAQGLADMDRFNQQLAADGRLGLALGLRPSSRAVRLKLWPGGEVSPMAPSPRPRSWWPASRSSRRRRRKRPSSS